MWGLEVLPSSEGATIAIAPHVAANARPRQVRRHAHRKHRPQSEYVSSTSNWEHPARVQW